MRNTITITVLEKVQMKALAPNVRNTENGDAERMGRVTAQSGEWAN